MNKLRIIGDVHGKYQEYRKIVDDCQASVQLGDFGFTYPKDLLLNHKILGGNHDNYDTFKECPNALDNYGTLNNFFDSNFWNIYYVRGAYSIDLHRRTTGVDWWEEEELTYTQCLACIEDYRISYEMGHNVDVMLTHDIPQEWCRKFFEITDSSKTRNLLQVLFEIHKPKLWIHGHHHTSYVKEYNGTRFIGLAELDSVVLSMTKENKLKCDTGDSCFYL
jgi:predicted phosphodiesterase